jgi:hypothetical protein
MMIGSLSSISIGPNDRLAMVKEAVEVAVAEAEANAETEEATVGGPRECEFEVNGPLASPGEQIRMRGIFAGGCERPRSMGLELAQKDEDAEGLAEDEEDKAEDACGVAEDALQASRFPRFSRRKRSMARSRGSVRSSGASGGR